MITTPASRTASRADAATTAPASASGAVADDDRSHTRVFRPAATRLRAIADPMMPAPITATVGRASLPFAPAMTTPSFTSLPLRPAPPAATPQAISSSMASGPAQRIAASRGMEWTCAKTRDVRWRSKWPADIIRAGRRYLGRALPTLERLGLSATLTAFLRESVPAG